MISSSARWKYGSCRRACLKPLHAVTSALFLRWWHLCASAGCWEVLDGRSWQPSGRVLPCYTGPHLVQLLLQLLPDRKLSDCVCGAGSNGEKSSHLSWMQKPQGEHNAVVSGVSVTRVSLCPEAQGLLQPLCSIPGTCQSVAGISLDREPGLRYFQHSGS